MKNRPNIKDYTGKRRITIEQDIYSKFLKYNIFQYYRIYFNLLIKRTKRQKGIKKEYKVNQAHLIQKLKKYLPIMILNPTNEIIRKIHEKTNRILHTITKQKCQKPNNNQKQEKTKKIQHQLQTNIKTRQKHEIKN